MELYKSEGVAVIRAACPRVAVLSERTVAELWGHYSCEVGNCFWIPCDADHVPGFVDWMKGRALVSEQIACAHQKRFRVEPLQVDGRRPRRHYLRGWDGHRIADPTIRAGAVSGASIKPRLREQMMTKEQMIDSVNAWCREHAVLAATPGSKKTVDARMVRYCSEHNLIDAPGCPAEGTKRGYYEKHACQLRVIRLLQGRAWSLGTINGYLFGRTLSQLRQLEHEELGMLKGDYSVFQKPALSPRPGQPRWA